MVKNDTGGWVSFLLSTRGSESLRLCHRLRGDCGIKKDMPRTLLHIIFRFTQCLLSIRSAIIIIINDITHDTQVRLTKYQ